MCDCVEKHPNSRCGGPDCTCHPIFEMSLIKTDVEKDLVYFSASFTEIAFDLSELIRQEVVRICRENGQRNFTFAYDDSITIVDEI